MARGGVARGGNGVSAAELESLMRERDALEKAAARFDGGST